jgi:hypothetical protein
MIKNILPIAERAPQVILVESALGPGAVILQCGPIGRDNTDLVQCSKKRLIR